MTFEDVAEQMERLSPEVSQRKMFGAPSLFAHGKAFACRYGEDMVFKLPDEAQREAALALPGAHLFEPMAGRPMREWVQVPPVHAAEWQRLAEAAFTPHAG